MDAFVLHGPRDLRLEQREEKPLGYGEVRLEVKRIGVCGSDIHYYEHFRIGQFIPRSPLVLGHEFSGVVTEKGDGVGGLEIGARVTTEPSIECGHCGYCRDGRYNLCGNLRFIGTAATVPHIDGGFAERVVVPASHCHVLDDSLSFGAGALVEPLAVGANAVARAGSVMGKRILVSGGGTIGQMVLAMARAMGGTDITLADPADFPREFALAHGASEAISPAEPGLAQKLYADGGYDIIFEASGAPSALSFAYEVARRGGSIIQVGTQPAEVALPANLVMCKELMVIGSFRYAHVFPAVLGFMLTGRVNVEDMITKVYPFADMPAAVERAASKKNIVKVQVER